MDGGEAARYDRGFVLGVKAVDKEGNESPVSVYRIVPRLLP